MTNLTQTSFKHVTKTALPLMFSALSGYSMFFIDRMLLAQHHISAMNAASSTGTIVSAFVFGGAVSIAAIAETFVGRYHGAKDRKNLAQPVWHMIFFALACTLPFILIAHLALPHWIAPYLLDDGLPFGQILLDFGAFAPLCTALGAFFVGRGETRIIFWASFLANVLNLGLDYLLIFGYQNWIPSLGTRGAAIATVIAEAMQCVWLAAIFLQKKHRDHYRTHQPTWHTQRFLEQVKKGYPVALSHMSELLTWAFAFHVAAMASPTHITVVAMGQSLFVLTVCATDGLSRGVNTIAANCLGAYLPDRIPTLIKSALKIHGMALLICAIPLLGMSGIWMQAFGLDANVSDYVRITLYIVWGYLAIDGIVWVLGGVLRAGGDTLFIFVCNSSCAWLFGALPTYIMVGLHHAPPPAQWGFTLFYAIINASLFWRRYRQGRWRDWHPETG